MKGKWPVKPVGELCDIIGGGTPSKSNASFYGGDIPWATVRDMKSDWIETTEHSITPEAIQKSATNILPNGTVVIASRVGLGKVCRVGNDTAINQDLRGFIPKARVQLDNLYLFWWFKSIAHQIVAAGNGATVQGVTLPFLRSLEIPLPPIDEQRRIVAVLDKAFAGIATATANAQKNLTNARALFEGYLQSIFTERSEGWTEYSFHQVCSISSKLVDPRLPDYIDLPHIGAGNMISRTGGIIDVMTAREEGLKSGKFLFDPSMVLYSKIRPYLMKACRPDFSGLCSADVYPLIPNPVLLDRNMLFHILMSDMFTAYAEAGSARAGMPKVNREHMFKYSVWLPDIKTQKVICEKLDDLALKCQNLVGVFQSKLAHLSELKQSLLQKAFAGELT